MFVKLRNPTHAHEAFLEGVTQKAPQQETKDLKGSQLHHWVLNGSKGPSVA